MSDTLQVEELVINDSFCNFCFQTNETDIAYWEEYLHAHPAQKETILEAMQIVLSLRAMLHQAHPSQNTEAAVNIETRPNVKFMKTSKRLIAIVTAAAAIVFALVIGIDQGVLSNLFSHSDNREIAGTTAFKQVFTTAKGVRKSLMLPDSTVIFLNAGSELKVAMGFGQTNRTVFLTGEAMFDVTHNKNLPFEVRLKDYDINVLGTVFNVRAYTGDETSETVLIKGKVQIKKKDGGDLTLVPLQKMVFKNKPAPGVQSDGADTVVRLSILPVAVSKKDGAVLETVWTQNRLEIEREDFASIKSKLERWYNVQIVFRDEEVPQYTFTATFEKENIREVLQILQMAYPFNFSIEKDLITIWK